MKHLGTTELETERLLLRRFSAGDDKAMFANWCADPDVTMYLRWPPHSSVDVTRHVLNEWIAGYEKPDFYQWAIVVKESGALIGSISVVKQDDEISMVHIGYCIGKAWWRKGFTSEALGRLMRFFFEDVGVNRIECQYDPRNANSGKVMQKAGLRREGLSRASDWNNLGICDAVHYALLATDYAQEPRPKP